MPLWIVPATDAPVGLAPLPVVLNSVLVVLFQVRLARFGTGPAAARSPRSPRSAQGAYLGVHGLAAATQRRCQTPRLR
ncbi:hypothetical protein [Streptomyces sp. NPDC006368]|uniref:hypothetical protein n=1 Tax=Streptomyces sp. NPDC006368 TaxID=3156760 RepID=UPI0033A64321